MMEQLRNQREELLWEKQRVETQLQEEWAKKLEEKDKNLQELQTGMKATLEKEIREKEQMMLEQLECQRAVLQVWVSCILCPILLSRQSKPMPIAYSGIYITTKQLCQCGS